MRTRATAISFLDAVQARMLSPVRAIQVDGGSEFQADFETACQERIYNAVRSHQSVGYRTPHQYLQELALAGKG